MPYANPDALVSTAWLAEHLTDPAVRIVDGSFKMPGVTPTAAQDYAVRHLPGAVFFDIDAIADGTSPLPHMLPDPVSFAASVGRLGLGDGGRIVVYDSVGLMSAARVWWMFRVFGHADVAVLDGGLPKWLAEGRPVDAVLPKPAEQVFTARFKPQLVRDKQGIAANIASKEEQVLDARAAPRFEGTVAEPRPGLRSGHIPGSLNLDFTKLTDPTTKTVLEAEKLSALFADAGIDMSRPVVASCGSGVTAGVLALGLHLLGHTEVAVYDGSWSEWGLAGDTPVETGPARR
ncbi:MAG TPA: 3-mercaptopyruvate sulfurtransferase [Stellaceae bacterium]|nr:3-mercaptopyruvate sulfurtransferase [Stellaceae bacterium]